MEEKEIQEMWNAEPLDVSQETIESSLKLLIGRINLFEYEKSARRRRRRISLWSCAAAVAVLIPLLAIFLTGLQSVEQVADRVVFAPEGEVREMELSDGTVVWLNSTSALVTPENFKGDERRVVLIGEAYFKVAKDAKRPFRVETRLMTVEALGTEFSVLAYSDNDCVRTTLVEGSVRVEAAGTNARILKPGEQSSYDPARGEIVVGRVNTELYTSWIEGNIIFENTPFADAVERLEIQFGEEIEYAASLKRHRVSAKFIRGESLEEILAMLSEITYSKAVKTEDYWEIR